MDRRGSRARAGHRPDRHRQLGLSRRRPAGRFAGVPPALVVVVLFLLASCSSTPTANTPPIAIDLALVNTAANILYFAGPVNLQFQVTLTNPTDQPVTLRRLDLRTAGSGSFYMRATGTPFHVEVKPHASTSVTMSAWGNSRGGYLAADEPISLQGTAYFDSPKGPFVRLVTANLSPR